MLPSHISARQSVSQCRCRSTSTMHRIRERWWWWYMGRYFPKALPLKSSDIHGTSFLHAWSPFASPAVLVLSAAIPCDSSRWVAVRQRIIRKIKIIIPWQEHCWQPRIIPAHCCHCRCCRKLWQFNYAAQWSTIHIHCILQLCMLQCVSASELLQLQDRIKPICRCLPGDMFWAHPISIPH